MRICSTLDLDTNRCLEAIGLPSDKASIDIALVDTKQDKEILQHNNDKGCFVTAETVQQLLKYVSKAKIPVTLSFTKQFLQNLAEKE